MGYFQTQVMTNADKVHFHMKVIIVFIRKASEDDNPIKTVYDSDSAVNLKYRCLDTASIHSTKSVTRYLTRLQYAKVPLKLLTPLT